MTSRFCVEDTGQTICGDTCVYKVTVRGRPSWEYVHVWFDATLDTCRCTACSGALSAMLTTCPHAKAVRRVIDKGRTMNTPEQMPLPLPQRTRVRLADTEVPAERTAWNARDEPPTSGWWEVRQLRGAPPIVDCGCWWWHAAGAQWFPDGMSRGRAQGRPMDEFRMNSYQWRGLTQPSPDVYPCPPYLSSELVPRAQAAGLSLRTTYVAIAPVKRTRVRL